MPGTKIRSDPSALPEGWDPALEPRLLALALRAIESRLDGEDATPSDMGDFPECLLAPRATFVTLLEHGALRGCIGSLESRSSLVESVWHNAREAAFGDPRFPPVSPEEVDDLVIHISVLSPLEPLSVSSERELLAQLRPGVDGLVLAEGERRGTFLPAVWESLPAPRDFVTELKRKAGLAPDHWSERVQLWRYTTYAIPD